MPYGSGHQLRFALVLGLVENAKHAHYLLRRRSAIPCARRVSTRKPTHLLCGWAEFLRGPPSKTISLRNLNFSEMSEVTNRLSWPRVKVVVLPFRVSP